MSEYLIENSAKPVLVYHAPMPTATDLVLPDDEDDEEIEKTR